MLDFLTRHKTTMPSADEALPGRGTPIVKPGNHAVLNTPMAPPFPDDTERAVFGMGCFWGAERTFWEGHDPTQGMRQGNDVGTQYRSGIYTTSNAQQETALRSKEAFAQALKA